MSESSCCSRSLSALDVVCTLNLDHFYRWGVVSHCFDHKFLMKQDKEHLFISYLPSVCILWCGVCLDLPLTPVSNWIVFLLMSFKLCFGFDFWCLRGKVLWRNSCIMHFIFLQLRYKKNLGSEWIHCQTFANYYDIWGYAYKEKHALDKPEDQFITKYYHPHLVPAFSLVFTIALTSMTLKWHNSFLMQYFSNQVQ